MAVVDSFFVALPASETSTRSPRSENHAELTLPRPKEEKLKIQINGRQTRFCCLVSRRFIFLLSDFWAGLTNFYVM